MNIAVFLPNWIGDAVMATPALRAPARHFPTRRIVGVLKPYVAGVARGQPWFDRIVLLRRRRAAGAALLADRPGALRRERDRPGRPVPQLASARPWSPGSAAAGGASATPATAAAVLLTDALRPDARRDGPAHAEPGHRRLQPPRRARRLPDAGPPTWSCSPRRADEAAADAVWQARGLTDYREVVCLNPGAAFGSAKHWPAESLRRPGPDAGRRSAAAACWCCAARPSASMARRIVDAGRPARRVMSLADQPRCRWG